MSGPTLTTTGLMSATLPAPTPYTGVAYGPANCDVDHVVAALEGFESGAWEWDVARRRAFGNDALNLVATRDCVNRSKGARDMAEWSGLIASGACEGLATTSAGRCYLAWKTVQVKAAFSLSVDQAEHDAIQQVLSGCPAEWADAPFRAVRVPSSGRSGADSGAGRRL